MFCCGYFFGENIGMDFKKYFEILFRILLGRMRINWGEKKTTRYLYIHCQKISLHVLKNRLVF